jgi:uncharacterized membrane protein YgdD (TMEM256/DUF423 family)
LGFTGIAFGAFGAHALKRSLSPEMLSVFETGVRYQMYHTFALFIASWGFSIGGNKMFRMASLLFTVGVVLFSGSLYLLSMTGLGWVGIITPFGGIAFLGGWLYLVRGFWEAFSA